MNDEWRKFAELEELLGALRDDAITDEQMAYLDRLLASDANIRDYYLEYMQLCATLGHFQGSLTTSCEEYKAVPFSNTERSSRKLGWIRWLLTTAAAAALLGLGLSLFYLTQRAGPVRNDGNDVFETENAKEIENLRRKPVAVLTRAVQAEWEGEAPTIGSKLSVGQRFRLRSGIVQLELFCGANLFVEGPADFELKGAQCVYCREGRMRARVASLAQGFTIESPSLELVDRGTEFGFCIDRTGHAEVHVFDGQVEVRPTSDYSSLSANFQQLKPGAGVSIGPSGAPRKIFANPDAFVSSVNLERQWRNELHRRHEKWLAYTRRLAADSRLLLYYNFQDQQPWERILLNRATIPKDDLNGVIIGCEWSEGRWPGKAALDFKRPSDRVRFHVPGRYESLTFLAWVRVDAFDQVFSALMLTDGWEFGAPHWQLTNHGALLLGIRSHPLMGYNYPSRPFLGPDKLGIWTQLVTVYDHRSQTVMHYVDGQLINQEKIELYTVLQIGNAEIGNWGYPRPQSQPQDVVRNFNGRIDEFALFREALSAQEIQRLYEVGKAYP